MALYPSPSKMLSTLIQRVTPLNFTAGDLSSQLPAFLHTINLKQFVSVTLDQLPGLLSTHSLAALYRDWPEFTTDWRPTALCLYFGLVITIGLIFRSHCSEEATKGDGPDQFRSPLAGGSPASGYRNALLNRNGGEIEIDFASAAQFAEELQVEEVLSASLLWADSPSSSIQKNSHWFRKSPESSKMLCAICFETKIPHKMFINPTCSHSFCIKCTSGHISAKIQENIKAVRCPELSCKASLDYNSCREVIPRDIIVKWDECLCKSMIPESQIVYCPFKDCSAMLVKDEGENIKRISCPACRRYICALCRVPYHSEFTCEEFRKLSEKKKGREELMLKELAKKKRWRQCPQCSYYVEKTEGCLHITCRCKYEFCYKCGSEWSQSHGSWSCKADQNAVIH